MIRTTLTHAMKVVIALDKFKGSLTAPTACHLVRQAILDTHPDWETVVKPMADGGDGTAHAMISALRGEWVQQSVTGPLPEQTVQAGYGWFDEERTVVVEMATASGLALLQPTELNPLRTTTHGTGQLVQAAAQHGARKVWLAVGGSATVDGGVGAAMALGWQFPDAQGKPVGLGGGELRNIAQIRPPTTPLAAEIEVLCDVNNPLCGDRGAARVFGPQKGATPEMVERLEAGLQHLAQVVAAQLNKDILHVPGAGAAGGLAAGAVAFMNARLVPGIDTIMQATGLESALKAADWVITGEGRFDEQSLHGKVVSGITAIARTTGTRVAVLAGSVGLSEDECRAGGVEMVIPLRREGISLDYALTHADELLRERTRELVAHLES